MAVLTWKHGRSKDDAVAAIKAALQELGRVPQHLAVDVAHLELGGDAASHLGAATAALP